MKHNSKKFPVNVTTEHPNEFPGYVDLKDFIQITPATNVWVDLALKGPKKKQWHRCAVLLWGLTKAGSVRGIVEINGRLHLVEDDLYVHMYRVIHPHQALANKEMADWAANVEKLQKKRANPSNN